MYKYTGLIKCGNCNHSFKARKERNNINYRYNYRLKYGKNKCENETMIEDTLTDDMIAHQLDNINMCIQNVDIRSIVDSIIVSKDRIRNIFQKPTYYKLLS